MVVLLSWLLTSNHSCILFPMLPTGWRLPERSVSPTLLWSGLPATTVGFTSHPSSWLLTTSPDAPSPELTTRRTRWLLVS